MQEWRDIMGLPIVVDVVDTPTSKELLEEVFDYFTNVDEKFSTYKVNSEVMRLNRGELGDSEMSVELLEVLALAEKTKTQTRGFFDIKTPQGLLDPSGIVKGWAIKNAAGMLRSRGVRNFYINAGGDIASSGKNENGEDWSVGIKNPFNPSEVIKIIYPKGAGVATSGSYERGAHIYNPHAPGAELGDVVSVTVLGPDVLEADRFATAAFAMGKEGIHFVESLRSFEGYSIDQAGVATMTSNFEEYTHV